MGNLEDKAMSTQNCQSMVNLFLMENKLLMEDIMKMCSKHKDSWIGGLGTIKATHHTTEVKKGARRNCQLRYRVGRRSKEVLCEHIHKQVEAGSIKPAPSD